MKDKKLIIKPYGAATIEYDNDNKVNIVSYVSPTGNCQMTATSGFNEAYRLTNHNITSILRNVLNSKRIILIDISNKRSIKKFDTYLKEKNIKPINVFKSDITTSYLINRETITNLK